MTIESITSGNVGANVYTTRAGDQKWDQYWWFSVPEGLTSIGFIAKLNEDSPVEATMTLFPPGTDAETTVDTDGRVQNQLVFPSKDPIKIGFYFEQSGPHVFVFRGGLNYHYAEKNRKTIVPGERLGDFLNLEIYELRYDESLSQDSSHLSKQIISQIEQERLKTSMPPISGHPHQTLTPSTTGNPPSPAPQPGSVPPTSQPGAVYPPSQGKQEAHYHSHVYVQDSNSDAKPTKRKGCLYILLAFGILFGILICCSLLYLGTMG